MDLKEIKKLIHLVEEANITEFSIESEGTKIDIKKTGKVADQAASIVLPQAPPIIAQEAPAMPVAAPQVASEQQETKDENLIAIKAQMVGTFYVSPNPDAPAYVSAGDKITTGQVICIIEAMKLFNEIESDCSGVIEKVCVENGTPVEYGQDLFLIRK